MSEHVDTEQLSAYLDGEVAPTARARLEAHLAGCPECAGRKEALARAAQAVATLPAVSPSPAEVRAIRQAVLERWPGGAVAGVGRVPWTQRVGWRLYAAGAGAAAVIVAGIFGYALTRPTSGSHRPTSGSAALSAPVASPSPPALSSKEEVLAFASAQPDLAQAAQSVTAADAAAATRQFLSQIQGQATQAPPEAFAASSPPPKAAAAAPQNQAGVPAQPAPSPGTLPACVQAVLAAQPQPLVPLKTVDISYRGTPAWLLAFASAPAGSPGGPLTTVQVWVQSQASCVTLEHTSLTP
jgi:anti-sigma factor RsiW